MWSEHISKRILGEFGANFTRCRQNEPYMYLAEISKSSVDRISQNVTSVVLVREMEWKLAIRGRLG